MSRLILPFPTARFVGGTLTIGFASHFQVVDGGGHHGRLASAVLLCSAMLPCPASWAPAHVTPAGARRGASGASSWCARRWGRMVRGPPATAHALPRAATAHFLFGRAAPAGPGVSIVRGPAGSGWAHSHPYSRRPRRRCLHRPRRRWRLARGVCPRRPRVALSAARWRPRYHRLLSTLGRRRRCRSPHRRRASLFPPFTMRRSQGSACSRRRP